MEAIDRNKRFDEAVQLNNVHQILEQSHIEHKYDKVVGRIWVDESISTDALLAVYRFMNNRVEELEWRLRNCSALGATS